jgi:hypothetical protein
VDQLRVGDCLTQLPKGSTLTLPVVPCTRRHLGEVYDVHALGDGAYPGDAQVDRLSQGRCRKTLPTFVRAPAGRTGYDIDFLLPNKQTWAAGDSRVICILSDPHGHRLTYDAKGKGRNPYA